MQKSFQRKLHAIRSGRGRRDSFILGDVKEADLALRGLPSGLERSAERPDATFPYRSPEAYLDQICELAEDSPLDVMLVSADVAAPGSGALSAFTSSHVLPAVRALPGHWMPKVNEHEGGPTADGPLPVFGVGFCRDVRADQRELDAYERFRLQAGAARARHILELYPSCGCDGGPPRRIADLMPDRLLHSILEVPPTARPAMIEVPYSGPRMMEALAGCLPGVPVGIVGGAAGTTLDAFQLLTEAQKYGAAGALFGRRISASEHQPSFVRFLDYLARGEISPLEAVHAYHGVLQELGITPVRELREDTLPTGTLFHGEESSAVCVLVPDRKWSPSEGGFEETEHSSHAGIPQPTGSRSAEGEGTTDRRTRDEEPDFDRMTVEEKLAYNQRRRDEIYG